MDAVLIYHKDRKGYRFAYNPKTNKGCCCIGDSLEYIKSYLSTNYDTSDYSDIYSYIQFAEQVNRYIPGTLYFEGMLIQPYEYW